MVEGLNTGASISGVGLETVDAGHLAGIRSGKAFIIIYANIDKEKEVKVVEKRRRADRRHTRENLLHEDDGLGRLESRETDSDIDALSQNHL